MYMCLQAWGLQLRVKVRSMCVCDWGGGGGGVGRIIREERGGRGERLFQPSVSCEMKAEGFARLMPGIR